MKLWCFAILLSSCQAADEVDFPPILDSDDIAYFFEEKDLDGLHWALSNVFFRSSRNPDAKQLQTPLPEQVIARGGGSSYTSAYKLRHDLEQAEYLAERLSDPDQIEFFRDIVAPTYKDILARIPPLEDLERTKGLYPFTARDQEETKIAYLYNKAIHPTDINELKDENGNPIPLINPNLDTEAIENDWFGADSSKADQHPGILVVDNILSPEALEVIQRIMLESTVFYQTKLPLRFGGYVGAYIDDGLHDRLLLDLSMQLHDVFPGIFRGHPLRYLWAYKYDSDYSGINLHADQAAVNVNIWLTPDEANLDKESGGLVVYTAKPPADWEFEKYNTDTEFVKRELLEPTGFSNVTIPYRLNRAVIFDSALFHQTDRFQFRPGYKNRRINLTLLYGSMDLSTSKDGSTTKDEL